MDWLTFVPTFTLLGLGHSITFIDVVKKFSIRPSSFSRSKVGGNRSWQEQTLLWVGIVSSLDRPERKADACAE
jgi:hypothetical protein